jgi:hypothetical protein
LLEAGGEPLLTLARGAVRPVLRRDRGAREPLLEVAPDDGRRAQGILEVALAQVPALVARVLPDAGQAVRLQLQPDGPCVLAGGVLLVLCTDALRDAEQDLDVMGDLVWTT